MAEATEAIRSGEINKIKDDLQRLRDDIGKLVGHIGIYGKGRLGGTREKVGATAEDFRGRAYDRVQGIGRRVSDRGWQATSASRDKIQSRPLTSIAVAFAAGMAFASIFIWKR